MSEFLVITLAAAIGAMGDLAGHERRGTSTWPARSAILGLLGGALGIRRDDPGGQAALSVWHVAVAPLGSGTPLRDYHTIQTIASTVRAPATRADALRRAKADGKLATTLTTRDYVTDCAFLVALWGGDLGQATQALRQPAFVPYLGRKSCPLSAPLDPQTVEAVDPVAALTAPRRLPAWLGGLPRPWRVLTDHFAGIEVMQSRTVEMRWDDPRDRQLWHFGPRDVHVLALEGRP